MKKYSASFILLSLVFLSFLQNKNEEITKENWKYLLKDNFNAWDVFIGVPHASLGMKGYENSDGLNGTPLGLNNDPKYVFSMVTEDGAPALRVTGEIYGGISTKEEFSNYHLKLQFKWGSKKYAPRTADPMDTGILYHAGGPHGVMWNVWMRAQEFQIQENDCGDYFRIISTAMDIPAVANGTNWNYKKGAPLKQFGGPGNPYNCKNPETNEKPNGEWNTLELICYGDTSIHLVNGKVMMALYNSRELKDGESQSLRKGKIQLQSEGAEVYFREIQMKPVTGIPAKLKKTIL